MSVFDAVANRVPGGDRVYLVAVMLMALAIAAGRLGELR